MGAGEIFISIFAGLRITLIIALYALVFAVPFAFIFGVLQHHCSGLARFATTAVIEFWRSSSTIVLLFVFFYVLPFVGMTLILGQSAPWYWG